MPNFSWVNLAYNSAELPGVDLPNLFDVANQRRLAHQLGSNRATLSQFVELIDPYHAEISVRPSPPAQSAVRIDRADPDPVVDGLFRVDCI